MWIAMEKTLVKRGPDVLYCKKRQVDANHMLLENSPLKKCKMIYNKQIQLNAVPSSSKRFLFLKSHAYESGHRAF